MTPQSRRDMAEAQSNYDMLAFNYVECDECGHTLEYDHDRKGCTLDGCPCRVGFTRRQVQDIRAENGLTRRIPPLP